MSARGEAARERGQKLLDSLHEKQTVIEVLRTIPLDQLEDTFAEFIPEMTVMEKVVYDSRLKQWREQQPKRKWDPRLIPEGPTHTSNPKWAELDDLLNNLGIIEAYNKWCGKSVPKMGRKREGIMVSCPIPGHEDRHPSAWVNTDNDRWFCGACNEGGDKYKLAAYRFGLDYKTQFPELKRRMGHDLGWVEPVTHLPTRLHLVEDVEDQGAPVEAPVNLPEAFWSARPVLDHIRQYAHHRFTPADSVLYAALARVSAYSSHRLHLPGIVGNKGTLNVYTALISPSGKGKSTSMAVAAELLPSPYDPVMLTGNLYADGVGAPAIGKEPSSGEGILTLYMGMIDKTDDTGAVVGQVRGQACHNVLLNVDEGDKLAELMVRAGNTLAPVLRSGWSGVPLGTANADEARNRDIREYRLAMVMGVQPKRAGYLLADEAGGLPQRFMWARAFDPTIPHPDEQATDPGPLDWYSPTVAELEARGLTADARGRYTMQVADSIKYEVQVARWQANTTEDEDDLDDGIDFNGHQFYNRLKFAGLLALLDGRLDVTDGDWELSGIMWDTSCNVRAMVSQAVAAQDEQKFQKEAKRSGRRTAYVEAEKAAAPAKQEAMLNRIRATIEGADGPVTASFLRKKHSNKSNRLEFDQAYERGVRERWFDLNDDGKCVPRMD